MGGNKQIFTFSFEKRDLSVTCSDIFVFLKKIPSSTVYELLLSPNKFKLPKKVSKYLIFLKLLNWRLATKSEY